jgi:HAD superfamily hydrolase (TIGR01549 family)
MTAGQLESSRQNTGQPSNYYPLTLDGIRAILFDLDGTLRHSRPSFNHALFDFAAEFGVPQVAEGRRRALRWAHYYFASSPEVIRDSRKYGIDRDAFMTNYLRRYLVVYGCEPERARRVAPMIYDSMSSRLETQDCVDPETPETLERLKGAGFTLGVVSNREQCFQDLLQTLGLRSFFAFTVAAGEVDSWKPDIGIFQIALDRAGSCPTCTVYVGDNYYADVIGAQRAGLQPVLLDPEGLFPEAECPVIHTLAQLQDVVD